MYVRNHFYDGSDLRDCCCLEEWLVLFVVSPLLFLFSLCSSSSCLCCSTSIWWTIRLCPFSLRRLRRKCAARSASSTNDIMVGGRLWPYIMALVLSRHTLRRFWRARMIEDGSFSLFSKCSIPPPCWELDDERAARFEGGSRSRSRGGSCCCPRRWKNCFFSFSMHPLVSLDRRIASESLDGLNRGSNEGGCFEGGNERGDNDILRGRNIPAILPGDSFLSESQTSAFMSLPLAMERATGFLSTSPFKFFTWSKSLLNVTLRRSLGRTFFGVLSVAFMTHRFVLSLIWSIPLTNPSLTLS